MTPLLPLADAAHRCFGYAEVKRYGLQPLATRPTRSHRTYINIGKFGVRVCLAEASGSVLDPIALVVDLRVPPQIRKSNVCSDAVTVATLHPLGAGSDKSRQYKHLNKRLPTTAALTQPNTRVAAYQPLLQQRRWLEAHAVDTVAVFLGKHVARQTKYASEVADFIQTDVASNGLPNFTGQVFDRFSQDRSPERLRSEADAHSNAPGLVHFM